MTGYIVFRKTDGAYVEVGEKVASNPLSAIRAQIKDEYQAGSYVAGTEYGATPKRSWFTGAPKVGAEPSISFGGDEPEPEPEQDVDLAREPEGAVA